MPCKTVGAGPYRAIVCSREPPKRCPFCKRLIGLEVLCDFPIGDGKTCDRAMCIDCRVNVGPNRDYCPDHPMEPTNAG